MTDPTPPPTPAPLDLHKYGRPELATHIHGLLEVGTDVRRVASVVVGGILAVWLATTLVFYDSGWLVWGGVVACGSFAAFELLSSMSAWWVLRSKLGHAISATEQVVEICLDVVNDIDAIAAGQAAAPSPAELVHSVFATLVHPIVMAQAAGSVFGRVLGWLYTRHTTAVERTVIDQIPAAHEPLPVHAIGEQRERIEAAAAVLQQAQHTGLHGLRHFKRHVLPAIALAALTGALLQTIPLAITTGLLAADSRAPRVTGVLSSPTPLIDPGTGAPACAVLLEARYDDPTGRTRDDGTPFLQTSTSFHVASDAMITVASTGQTLQIEPTAEQPWASNQLLAGQAVPEGTLPDFLPAQLRSQTHLRLRTDTVPCNENHTLYGTQTGDRLTLDRAPPLPAMRVLGGMFLLYLAHQFGVFPVVLSLMYATAHLAYLILLRRSASEAAESPS